MTDYSDLPSASATRTMDLRAVDVWRTLSDLGALASWAPGIEGVAVTSTRQSGVGAMRDVTTAQFGVITHKVTDWNAPSRFAYITADSGPFAATYTVYEIEEDKAGTRVSVTLSFELKPGSMALEQAQTVLSKGLTATLQALEMHAKTVSA